MNKCGMRKSECGIGGVIFHSAVRTRHSALEA
jgi:hypothetical protein